MSSHQNPEQDRPAGVVDQNVEAIMALHNADLLTMSRHHRAVEKMVHALTFPAFLFSLVILMALWIGANLTLRIEGHQPWDPPPFPGLQTIVSVVALVMTSLIIITQRRQGALAERNAHLDLQVNLLVDQKAAKIIQLLEEIRTDSPTLKNRRDELAEELQIAVDPTKVALVIAEKMSLAGSTTESESDQALLKETADD